MSEQGDQTISSANKEKIKVSVVTVLMPYAINYWYTLVVPCLLHSPPCKLRLRKE
jgi:hypothetical protein